MSKRKWAKGEVITSMDVFMDQQYIWFNDKVYSAGWFQSWQSRYAHLQLKSGNVFKVVPAVYPATIVYNNNSNHFYCSICRAVVTGYAKYCCMCGTKFKLQK